MNLISHARKFIRSKYTRYNMVVYTYIFIIIMDATLSLVI